MTNRSARVPVRLAFTLFCLLLPAGILQGQSTDIKYIYDSLGRLVAVVDPAGDTAVYSYDAVGNILSISRRSSSQVSVIEFSPRSGPVGTSVEIYGTGFSTSPSDDTVKFNAVKATLFTVVSATQITARVPAGATTGPISVIVSYPGTCDVSGTPCRSRMDCPPHEGCEPSPLPGGTGTSTAPFTVTASTGAPTITSFVPTIGTPGTALTITGTNFEAIPGNNNVKMNITRAVVASTTATSIATSVPSGVMSGRISVATPFGEATSNTDFFVPPSPFTASDVEFSGRMAIGGTSTVSINTVNKIGLMVFDGAGGQRISLTLRRRK